MDLEIYWHWNVVFKFVVYQWFTLKSIMRPIPFCSAFFCYFNLFPPQVVQTAFKPLSRHSSIHSPYITRKSPQKGVQIYPSLRPIKFGICRKDCKLLRPFSMPSSTLTEYKDWSRQLVRIPTRRLSCSIRYNLNCVFRISDMSVRIAFGRLSLSLIAKRGRRPKI